MHWSPASHTPAQSIVERSAVESKQLRSGLASSMPAPEENNCAKKRKLEEVSAAEKQLEAIRAGAEMAAGRSDAAAKQEQQPIESQASGDEKESKVEPEQKPAADAAAALEVEKNTLRRLLEPFSREQLVEILTSAATQYDALYTELKAVAGADVAHRKVFVRGLAWETKTEHLKEAFAAFGDVQEGAVIYDKATGKSRGYGFVTFVDMEAAQRAIDKQTITIDVRIYLLLRTG
ncbi:hypothetical protein BBJ28_00012788 [Nothophytophthora sp. Chile5]|nr:hypothetical protein BBJ28_00012788 [Nothophytophthora sp. Chile5]